MGKLIDLPGMGKVETVYFGPIKPLSDELIAVPNPFPLSALPGTLAAAVQEVCGVVQCPVSMVVGSALGALSLAISPHVHMERGSGLVGPTNLFVLTLGESGERKTTVDGYFLRPAREIQNTFNQQQQEANQRYQAQMKSFKARVKGLERAIMSAEKKGDTEGVARLSVQLEELEGQKPAEPEHMQLLFQDFTTEGLLKALTQWPYGIINSSEAGMVLGGYGTQKERQLKFFATLNQLWDDAYIHVSRSSMESYAVQGVSVTLCLMTQPSSLQSFLSQTGELSRGTGFFARCLLSIPESTIGERPYQEPPSHWPALNRYNAALKPYLENLPAMTEGRILQPARMQFTPEAKACWVAFHDRVEASMATGGPNDRIRDLASKAADNMARLACLFHVLECGKYEPVGLHAVEQAAAVMDWYLVQGRSFLLDLEPHNELQDAEKVLEVLVKWCRSQGTDRMPLRQLQSRVPRHLRRKAALDPLLEVLRHHNLAESFTQMVVVNPALLR